MSKLDDILKLYEIFGGDKVLYRTGEYNIIADEVPKFKQQVKDLMLEVIGPDYTTTTYGDDAKAIKIGNQVKAQLRQKVNEL